MKSFDILQRGLDLEESTFLEASAGTGKTFAIENFVVRWLIESKRPIEIQEILIVTFTNAATRELKQRIYLNIRSALTLLEAESYEKMPDYLMAIVEEGHEKVDHVKKQLKQALTCFDDAQIFTIHGFCAYCLKNFPLEGNCPLRIDVDADKGKRKLLELLRDFLRSNLVSQEITAWQLNILLQHFGNDLEKLLQELCQAFLSRKNFANQSFVEVHDKLTSIGAALKQKYALQKQSCLKDLERIAPCFSKMCDQKRQIKKEVHAAINFLAQWLSEEDHIINELFSHIPVLCQFTPNNLLKRQAFPEDLNYPQLWEDMQSLIKLLEYTSNPKHIFGRLAELFIPLAAQTLQEYELFFFDDLLLHVQKRLNVLEFVQKLQNQYKAVVIDEFQDTDPIQWNIFSRLFLKKNGFQGPLCLIGDPKQSIYAFRKADIYTYLQAKAAFNAHRIASLNINYRSQPQLIAALNTLFTHSHLTDFFELPKIGSTLACEEVFANPHKNHLQWNDGMGGIHFYIHHAKKTGKAWPNSDVEASFYPSIAQAIYTSHKNHNIPLKECAILVKDRYQAKRIEEYLVSQGLPALTQRRRSLMDSAIFQALIELLQGTLSFHNKSCLNIALGGLIIGFTDAELENFYEESQEEWRSYVLLKFQQLNAFFEKEGLIIFLKRIFQERWNNRDQCLEKLLNKKEGFEFYNDLMQLAELVCAELIDTPFSPPSLKNVLKILQDFKKRDSEEEKFQARQSLEKDAIPILTMHMSKGLEYEIIIPLGLICRNTHSKSLMDNADLEDYLEIDAEKMRLLYVALTRAKSRLYVPILFEDDCQEIEKGSASPMELFLGKLLKQPYPLAKDFVQFIEKIPSMSWSELANSSEPFTIDTPHTSLKQPERISFSFPESALLSFTSLKKDTPAATDIETVPSSSSAQGGISFGIQVHQILEKISFPILQAAQEPIQLLEEIKKLHPEANQEMIEMIFNALKTPLGQGLLNFSLEDIPLSKMKREMAFLIKSNPDYLTGSIDLFFEHQEKYYIVDWKTNYLGPNKSDYQKAHLTNTMQAQNYFLQAEIYASALARYLRIFEKKSFQEIFGGMFVLFIRGMNRADNSNTGIFHFFPEPKFIKEQ